MQKYWHIYTMTITKQLSYRINFILGRFSNLIILLLLYSVWVAVGKNGGFGGFTIDELISYVAFMHVLRGFVFGSFSTLPAEEINDGTFSIYLVKPLNHQIACYMRDLADRTILTINALTELWLVHKITGITFFKTIEPSFFVAGLALFFVAHLLYFAVSYCLNLLAFWSHEAVGPRFLFTWITQFTSGAYFPLFITPLLFLVLKFTPFPSFAYYPVLTLLGKISFAEIWQNLLVGAFWIVLGIFLSFTLWRRGLKRYSGQGI